MSGFGPINSMNKKVEARSKKRQAAVLKDPYLPNTFSDPLIFRNASEEEKQQFRKRLAKDILVQKVISIAIWSVLILGVAGFIYLVTF
jgi:hypothetical protein